MLEARHTDVQGQPVILMLGHFSNKGNAHNTDNHHLPHLDTSSLSDGSLNMQNVDTVFTVSHLTSQTDPRYKLD